MVLQATRIARIKRLFTATDFAHPDDEAYELLAILDDKLTLGQRLVWKARYCGLVRGRVNGRWQDVSEPAPLDVFETADAIGGNEDEVRMLARRAALRLIEVL